MNTAATRNDWVGRVIDGKFPLLEWLGSTEKAGVFRTELTEPQAQRAVIKIVPADGDNPEDRLRDWESAAELSHPHLMRIFQCGRVQAGSVNLLYVVTEYAEESLAQVIPERPLSTVEAREMLGPILDALSYLHGQGLVHGHLKPSNVMVVNDRVKLPIESVRRAGRLALPPGDLGTCDAPELNEGILSSGADIWSLGAMLVEALTQNPPAWDRSSKSDPVVPQDVPQPFAEIARVCLRHDPARRRSLLGIEQLLEGKQTPQEPANEIDQGMSGKTAEGAHATGAASASGVGKGIVAVGMIALIALIVFLVMRAHKSEPSAPQSTSLSAPAVTESPSSPPPTQAPPPSGATAKGAVVERVTPNLLASANRTITGKVDVRVRLNVDKNGGVSEATLDSRGPSRYFSTKALEAARQWRFKPAQVNGEAAPSVWVLHFEFRRSGPEVSAQQISP